ncbi:cupin domain-containing protein [Azospirillum picis]|uniref:Quercetin dioxygenase-like cupin family protein n=1 Tax=Azospirillum picis TaxID=488438 RepID=A0ABU0MHP0_9PROT|nr:cupin domain-containing protein [Azospirillum picis]MBP2299386.1 quercetin dioxygenase-like cupin family protein [Azospirillum picis]MDQ0532976.1 quercetin dioxygenase-like cupin family protein [Azospirillum picis]
MTLPLLPCLPFPGPRPFRLRRAALATVLLAAGALMPPAAATAQSGQPVQVAQKEITIHQPAVDPHSVLVDPDSRAPRSVVLLETSVHSDGKPIVYPKGTPQILARVTEIPVGAKTGVHSHPIPLVTYILNGVLTIQSTSGETKTYKPGDAFVERTDWHEGINQGIEPVRLLAVYAGEVGAPLSIKPSN